MSTFDNRCSWCSVPFPQGYKPYVHNSLAMHHDVCVSEFVQEILALRELEKKLAGEMNLPDGVATWLTQ